MTEATADTTGRGSGWRPRRVSAAVWALLALQVVLVGAVIGAWMRSRDLAPRPTSLPPVRFGAGTHGPATLEGAYPLALAEAQRWNAKSDLLSAEEEVDWPVSGANPAALDTPAGGWLIYVFVAPYSHFGLNTQAATLSVMVERNSAAIVNTQTSSWQQRPPPLAVQPIGLKITSSAALAAAESAVGQTFRHDCPAVRHVTRIGLNAGAGSAPVWVITYTQDRDDANNALTLRIDAQTGEVAPILDRAPSCSPTPAALEAGRHA